VIGQLLNQPERSFADDVEASDSLKTSVTHKHLLQVTVAFAKYGVAGLVIIFVSTSEQGMVTGGL